MVDRWIRVEDGLPESGVMVLFCSMKCAEARDWCFVDWLSGPYKQLTVHDKYTFTHWMPIPPVPEEARDE